VAKTFIGFGVGATGNVASDLLHGERNWVKIVNDGVTGGITGGAGAAIGAFGEPELDKPIMTAAKALTGAYVAGVANSIAPEGSYESFLDGGLSAVFAGIGLPISDEWASTIFTSGLSIGGTICDPNLLLLRPYC
jgi:hypothetical protein